MLFTSAPSVSVGIKKQWACINSDTITKTLSSLLHSWCLPVPMFSCLCMCMYLHHCVHLHGIHRFIIECVTAISQRQICEKKRGSFISSTTQAVMMSSCSLFLQVKLIARYSKIPLTRKYFISVQHSQHVFKIPAEGLCLF